MIFSFLPHKNRDSIRNTIVLILISVSLNAQYPFIKYNENYLHYSNDSSSFLKFFKKMDDLKQGKRNTVTIAHYGGSHIQAGIWSEKLIDNFQAMGPYEGGGMWVFPYKIVRANSPHFYSSASSGKWKRCRCALAKEMCDNLGMNGIAAVTNDSVNDFSIKMQANNHHKNFTDIRVYHNFNPSFKIEMDFPTSGVKRTEDKNKEYSYFSFDSEIDSVHFAITRLDTLQKDFILYGTSIENKKPGFYYAGFGVNGASSSSYLRCNHFVEQLKTLPPDLVVFSLGVNDTQAANFSKEDYIAHYDSLITLIKMAAPDCAILFTTTTDNYIHRKTSNKRPIIAGYAMYDLMKKHHAAVWDIYEIMGGYRSIYKWLKAGLAAKDKVHFNSRGYNLIGQMMFEAIEKSYKNNTSIKP